MEYPKWLTSPIGKRVLVYSAEEETAKLTDWGLLPAKVPEPAPKPARKPRK